MWRSREVEPWSRGPGCIVPKILNPGIVTLSPCFRLSLITSSTAEIILPAATLLAPIAWAIASTKAYRFILPSSLRLA